MNRNEPIKNAAVIISQLNALRQQVVDVDPEQPGKLVDEGALHIIQYFLKEIAEGNSPLIRHSTELKRIFGADFDQAKARKFFQVTLISLTSQFNLLIISGFRWWPS